VECTIDNAFNLRDLVLQELVKIIFVKQDLVNWKHHRFHTPPTWSAWRWPYNWAETCSWNYNL